VDSQPQHARELEQLRTSLDAPPSKLHDTAVRTKVALLVTLGVVAGVGIGLMESRLGHRVWPFAGGMLVALTALLMLASWWVSSPLDRLVVQLERLARMTTREDDRPAPVRRDEVSRIARAVYALTATGIRNAREAQHLRRTLNSQVQRETKRATALLQQIAMRDALTELGNRRLLTERLGPLTDAAADTDTDLICVMIDMDNFKSVNDTLGHAVGDELLVVLASLLKATTRQDDLVVRLGGDEFTVLMPGATVERAVALTQKLRKLFRQQTRAMRPSGPHADLSAGVASLRLDRCNSGEALLQAADHHLYEAKRGGKGRTQSTHYITAKAG